MTGLEAVQARVAQLRSTLGVLPPLQVAPSTAAGSTSSTSFASALADAVGASTPAAATGADAVSLARTFTGVPYRWGGTNPATGLDCSGLTQLVYGRLGVELPRVAADQSHAGTAVASLAQARPGDLVFFGSPAHHVGIYVGDGKMIDAPHTGSSVGVHSLYGTPSAIRRVLPASSPSSSGTLDGVPYASLFTRAGARYGVDPALLAAVAKTESGFDPSAVSPAGAKGLMQLMPGTAASLGVDALDPAQAVDGSARLLKQLLGRFGGRVDLALAGYNAGPGAVDRYGGIPPYAETRTYVQRVTAAWEAYR
ncbi:MAG TPA: transglycosylase SLT domain-containing protein [Kineosporiaceae bacterium]|nr:transglycosylase SLT domain-containing protein [Kineosporiaceae bacterium]